MALSYVANKLFTPDEPEEQAKPSSVYTIATGQNTAKYGSPIPIVYGKVRMYPSMIVNPFYRFEDNIEYLYHVLCIGQGQYTTDSVMIGEDTITTAGDLQYKLMNKDTFYNIPANAYGIHITRTLSSPSNLELKEGVLTERYTIKQGTQTVEFDYHYPNGLYATNSSGEYIWGLGAFNYFIHSSTGTLLYTGRRQDAGISADPIQWTVSKYVGAWTVDDTITISFQQDVTVDDPGYSEKNYIKRVKEIYPNKDFTQLYGDITLLACKIKATNAVSSAGQVKVNGYFTRTDVGNSMEEVLTDIYTNTNYGGGLDINDLDFPITDATVDCAYESNQTIFDAMRKPALAQGYSVFLAGMDVIMKKDGVNTITSGMYNEQNILRDSLKVQYLFKEESPSYDGYEVSYIDGCGWLPKTVTYPTNAIRPQKVDLFGVVDWSCLANIENCLVSHYLLGINALDSYGTTDGTPDSNIVWMGDYARLSTWNAYVQVGAFNTTKQSSSMWFRRQSLTSTSNWEGLIHYGDNLTGDNNLLVALFLGDGSYNYAMYIDNVLYTSSEPALSLNEWHHVVMTTDGQSYINGKLVIDGTVIDGTSSASRVVLGADRDNTSNINDIFQGDICNARFYNCVIDQDHVNLLYAEGPY